MVAWAKVLQCAVLIFGSHVGSLSTAIRYGFLAVSFRKRGIPGIVFGFVEGSAFFGFLLGFICQKYWNAVTEKLLPKWLAVITLLIEVMTAEMACAADFAKDNTLFIALSVSSRIIFSFVEFPKMVAILDMIKTVWPGKFDFLNGVNQMASFAGHAVGQYVGVVLYDVYGYKAPFLYTTALMVFTCILFIAFLPACPSIATQGSGDEEVGDEEDMGVTWYIGAPLLACMLVNIVSGSLQVTCVPYLLDTFNVPLPEGGIVLITLSLGMAIGSVISGVISQTGKHTYTQMSAGGAILLVGVMLFFPSRTIPFLYNNVANIAFAVALLAGSGDPFMTISTLRAMIDLQKRAKGKCTGRNHVTLFGAWLIGNWGAMYSGSIVAGVLGDYMSYGHQSYVLMSLLVLSIVISVAIGQTHKASRFI